MAKVYHRPPKGIKWQTSGGVKYYYDQNGHCINEYGQRDVLLGMVLAGEALGKAPLIDMKTNNYARSMNGFKHIHIGYSKNKLPPLEEFKARRTQRDNYSDITSTFRNDRDLSEDIKELKRLSKEHHLKTKK